MVVLTSSSSCKPALARLNTSQSAPSTYADAGQRHVSIGGAAASERGVEAEAEGEVGAARDVVGVGAPGERRPEAEAVAGRRDVAERDIGLVAGWRQAHWREAG